MFSCQKRYLYYLEAAEAEWEAPPALYIELVSK